MHQLVGSCHCGNIGVSVGLPREPHEYCPRVCDCEFCRKHGASYFSDPGGILSLRVADRKLLHSYRQGSGTAEMLLCKNCGVLIGGVLRADGEVFAAINTKVIDANVHFGDDKIASPKLLSVEQKTERWRKLWFRNVEITFVEA